MSYDFIPTQIVCLGCNKSIGMFEETHFGYCEKCWNKQHFLKYNSKAFYYDNRINKVEKVGDCSYVGYYER